MKKLLLCLFSFCLIFILNFQYTFSYELKSEIKNKIDLKFEKVYTKIGDRNLKSQVSIYKKLKTRLNILKIKYKNEKKIELINYIYGEVKKKYSKVFKEYALEKNTKNNNEKIEKKEVNREYVKLIRKYYNNISRGRLEEAFFMKYKPNTSLEGFKKIYNFGDSTTMNIHGFSNIGENKINFKVDIGYDTEKVIERYNTSMEIVSGNKLKTLSVKKIEKEIIEEIDYNNMKFYIEWNKGIKTLYVEKDGIKKIIKSIKVSNNMSIFNNLYGLEILDGGILLFREEGWEYRSINIYIINEGKLIEGEGGLSQYGFTKDKRYFYICGEAGMGGSSKFEIYNTKDFSIFKDLSKDYGDIDYCKKYNEKENTFEFYLYSEDNRNNKYIFDFNTFEIEIIRPYDKLLDRND